MKQNHVFMSLALLAASAQADIIISGGWLNATSVASLDGSGTQEVKSANIPASDLNTLSTAELSGIANQTRYDFQTSGNTGILLTTFDLTVSAAENQYGSPSNQGKIEFQVTGEDPVLYDLTGVLSTQGAGTLLLSATLKAESATLFENSQISSKGEAETYDLALGEDGGEFLSVLTGEQTGLLIPGYYSLDYSVYSTTELGGSAQTDGYIRLAFDAPAPAVEPPGIGSSPGVGPEAVPEPSTLVLLGLGLGVLFAVGRRGAIRKIAA